MYEEKYSKLINELDALSNLEKKYALWYLLKEYYDNECKNIENPETLLENIKNNVNNKTKENIKKILDMLYCDIWLWG